MFPWYDWSQQLAQGELLVRPHEMLLNSNTLQRISYRYRLVVYYSPAALEAQKHMAKSRDSMIIWGSSLVPT